MFPKKGKRKREKKPGQKIVRGIFSSTNSRWRLGTLPDKRRIRMAITRIFHGARYFNHCLELSNCDGGEYPACGCGLGEIPP